MAYRLKMAQVNAIQILLAQGWSHREIARKLKVHRHTVARYAKLGNSKCTKALTGSAPESTTALSGSAGSRSLCEPHRALILSKLDAGLTATRIHQDLTERGVEVSYFSVMRFVRRLRARTPLPFRRMERDPGTEAQIDFGRGPRIKQPDGRFRNTHIFRIVLSHSRKAFSEAVYRQTTDSFIRCIENALRAFGGSPKTLVIDNLKAGVITADWYDPEVNPKLRSFCEHYGVALLPDKPHTPRHKGKIERGVGYVKGNGLKAHEFASLQELNEHLHSWEENVADTRIHGTTRKQVRQQFEDVERPALQALPIERFPDFREGQRTVHRDAHVAVAKAYYSVPPEHLGRQVWVRWDERLVRIFDKNMQIITTHVRHEEGRFSTDPAHIASAKISRVEHGLEWLLERVARIGPHTRAWSEAMVQHRGVEGLRVLNGVLSLASRHRWREIEHASAIAHSHGSYGLKALKQLIAHNAPKQEQMEFIDEHPIIRDLSAYGRMVAACTSQEQLP